jgi:glycosyltransferase involved in cell wall biosynthesis
MSLVRVVHVVVAGETGGAERFLVDLASRPEASGAEHVIALLTPNDDLRRMFSRAGLRVVDRGPVRESPIAYLRTSLGRREVAWVQGVIEAERAHVVHVHTFQSHVLGARAALRAGVPSLRTEHDTRYYHDPSTSPFTRWALRRTQVDVTCSEWVREHVARTAPWAAEKLVVVRNGVDADAFAPRPELAPTEGPLRFVLHCRLEPAKQPDVVVRAVSRVPGARLDVVGTGSMLPELERLVRELGVSDRVRLLGYQPDPREAIARADVAISGSRHESLGLAVLEALSMGKPVVAFAVGGIPEIVRDGQTGWLVGEPTAGALERALLALPERAKLRRMGEAARRFVDAECRIERMCLGYAEQYRRLAGRG